MAPKKGDDDDKKKEKVKVVTDIKILKTDMSDEPEMTERPKGQEKKPTVVDVKAITDAVWQKNLKLHKDVASAIKAEFDAQFPPADNKATSGVWHCIVGSDFACSVTHETHFSCFWSCNNVKLLIWKSKDSPFD